MTPDREKVSNFWYFARPIFKADELNDTNKLRIEQIAQEFNADIHLGVVDSQPTLTLAGNEPLDEKQKEALRFVMGEQPEKLDFSLQSHYLALRELRGRQATVPEIQFPNLISAPTPEEQTLVAREAIVTAA